MILPPFFGLYSKQDQKDINNLLISYINADIVTYSQPKQNVLLSSHNLDVLSYTQPSRSVNLSFHNVDFLSYNLKYPESYLSAIYCDVLFFELPPNVPGKISNAIARDKDSSAIIKFDPPNDGKSSIIKYNVQYKKITDNTWTTYPNNNANTTIRIGGLENLQTYEFRISAQNRIGEGEYTTTNRIIPSGGIDTLCSIVSYSTLSSTANENFSFACFNDIEQRLVFTSTVNIVPGPYNNAYAAYFDGEQFPIFTTVFTTNTHGFIPRSKLYSWSLIDNFTISFWIKPADSSTSGTILSTYSDTTKNNWKISYNNDSIVFASGNGTNLQTIISASNLNLDSTTFSHIALCRSNGYISLFVNGIEKNEVLNNNNITIDSEYLILGAYAPNFNFIESLNIGTVIEPFKGSLAELFISKDCLYRKNFESSLPAAVRSRNSVGCSDCDKLTAPTDLQVVYITE